MAVDTNSAGFIAASHGWKFVRICCNGKHHYHNANKPGWILYLFPNPKAFQLLNNHGLRVASGDYNILKETLTRHA